MKTFGEKEISTQVYIKVDAADQLLLSEGVSRLLGIVEYHPDVQIWRGGRKKSGTSSARADVSNVPSIRVTLVKSVKAEYLHPHQGRGTCLLEPGGSEVVQVERSCITLQGDGKAQAVLTNMTGFTQILPAESEVGIALQCEEVKPSVVKEQKISSEVRVNKVMSQDEVDRRREKLKAWISEDHSFEQVKLKALLSEFHEAFSLDDDERGETDLVQLTIDTGDAPLRRQSARRIPMAAQQELAQLLESMQKSHVIQPSESPWASPVVLVRKKDGSLRL